MLIVQDRTPKGENQYNNVFYFLIALKAVDVFYGMGYDVSPSVHDSYRPVDAERRHCHALRTVLG